MCDIKCFGKNIKFLIFKINDDKLNMILYKYYNYIIKILFPEESDADVEDNIEGDHFHPEIGESGYSSEKASAVTSPISLTDPHHHPSNDFNNDINNLTSLEDGNLGNNADITQIRHLVNINVLTSPSPTDVSMTDLTQIRMLSEKSDRNVGSVSSENEASVTALSTSMIPNSDVTTPEVPTASLSSSIASKESPTSPVNDSERLYIQMFKCFKNFTRAHTHIRVCVYII